MRFTAPLLLLVCALPAVAQPSRSPQAGGILLLAPFQMTGVRPADSENVLAPKQRAFNIQVPVKVIGLMPDVQQVKVDCRLYNAKPTQWMGKSGLVASWTELLPVDSNGNVEHTTQASFDPIPPAKPQDAKYYQCGFRLVVEGAQIDPDPAGAKQFLKTRPSTPYLSKQEGPYAP